MPTRYPRIPNVRPRYFTQFFPVRSLAQAVAEHSCRSITTLKPSTTLPIPIASKIDKANTSSSLQQYDRLAAAMVRTAIDRVDPQKLGKITFRKSEDLIDEWDIEYDDSDAGDAHAGALRHAADELVNTEYPVAFPTETVYGLGGCGSDICCERTTG
jgi:L-threonylcarbamoyladenylate synthase